MQKSPLASDRTTAKDVHLGASLRLTVTLLIVALLGAAGVASADPSSGAAPPTSQAFQFMTFSERESASGRRYKKLSIMRYESLAHLGGKEVFFRFKAPGGGSSFASFELRF